MPLALAAEGIDRIILKLLHLPADRAGGWRRGSNWSSASRIPHDELTIHVVGKYVGYEDSYKSLNEALYHGGFAHRVKVNIHWVEAEALEGARRRPAARRRGRHSRAWRVRQPRHARDDEGRARSRASATCPTSGSATGSSGRRSSSRATSAGLARGRLHRVRSGDAAQGHLQAARPARRRRPGRHDAARAVPVRADAGLAGAQDLRRRRRSTSGIGIATSSTASTRRRSPRRACVISGRSPDGKFVEIVELPGHPWYMAVQFHPEFKSKPLEAASAVRQLRRGQLQAQAGLARCGGADDGASARRRWPRHPGSSGVSAMISACPACRWARCRSATVPRWSSSPAPASSRARSHALDIARALRASPPRRACRSSSRRRSTRRTARRGRRSAARGS